MFKKTLIAAAIASLSGGAYAESQGFYMGGGLGMWNVDEDGFEESAMSARIAGGYRMNEYLSFEGAYVYLGEIEDDFNDPLGSAEMEIDGSAWEFSVRPSYPFTDQLEGYARLGWGFYDIEAEMTLNIVGLPPVSATESDTDDAFVWAVGGAWAMNDRFNLFGEYSVPDTEADVYMWTFGATYNF